MIERKIAVCQTFRYGGNLSPTFKTEYPALIGAATEKEITNVFLIFFCPK